MRTDQRMPVALVLLALGWGARPVWADGQDLGSAVKELNEKAKKDRIGKDQPELTEDEVVAAIRGWLRDRYPVSDAVYETYQEIADTRRLPDGATLTFTTGWQFNGYEFDVWWVDVNVRAGKATGYTYRIRDRKIAARPRA